MLVIDKDFVERWSAEYDCRTQGTYAGTEEAAILDWVSKQREPKFLNRAYFIRLARWKTPRWQKARQSNNEQDIIEATRSAYAARYDLEKLTILGGLKGVGIAVASTILYYLQPDNFAIYDYHALNSLKKAGQLSEAAKGNSSKVWLAYTRKIRELSTLYDKTLRAVEKALYAYDKWGRGGNDLQHKRKGGQLKVTQHKKKTLLTQVEIENRINVIRNDNIRTLCYKCLDVLQQKGCDAVHCRKDNISVHDGRWLLLRFCPSARYFSIRYKKQPDGKLGERVPVYQMKDFEKILDDLRSWKRIAW